ncbi:Glutamyl-tRNA(Gln) amidotransferase subunit F-like protein [Ceratocystis lukuohia]|uniref:Glutamyl-tRNA amidotransferase complex subunit Gta3 domain-containing protein n=2 Tax=Ceratocystis TaxID=5157 RepID=A0A0F8B1H5_CERFI|nr:hypothetical protein CFO_g4152 [Ceratocystis platani]
MSPHRTKALSCLGAPSRFSFSARRNLNYSASLSSPPPPSASRRSEISALLSTPTWSTKSLIRPPASSGSISPAQLHHLLRLSALPPPSSPDEEAEMLRVLHAQLGFVQDVQSASSASGLEPLRAIYDETPEAIGEAMIGLDQLQALLTEEKPHGYLKRPKRQRETAPKIKDVENWDKLAMAEKKVDKYFVVKGSGESAE